MRRFADAARYAGYLHAHSRAGMFRSFRYVSGQPVPKSPIHLRNMDVVTGGRVRDDESPFRTRAYARSGRETLSDRHRSFRENRYETPVVRGCDVQG